MKSDLAARVAASGTAPEQDAARRAIAGSKRVLGGRKFEDDMTATHGSYHTRRWGCIRQHFAKTVVTGKDDRGLVLRLAKGGNPVDYSGHVNLRRKLVPGVDSQAFAWHCCTNTEGTRVPVQFDVKRLTAAPSYIHAKDELHQLLELREAERCGAAAFLLVYTAALERVFILGPAHFEPLMRQKRVTLYERVRGADPVFRLPSCGYVMGFGYNYAPLIPLACPDILSLQR